MMEDKSAINLSLKRTIEIEKISQMLITDKNISVKISIKSVKRLLKKSLDKNKLDKLYMSSIEETKLALKTKFN